MDKTDYLKLWIALNRTTEAIGVKRREELKPYGISKEQAIILLILRTLKEPPTQAHIARLISRKRSTITVTVNRMIAKGLVKKNEDTKRKNQVRITMTRKGRELSEQVQQQTYVIKIMSTLSDEQCVQLKKCLSVLLSNAKASTI